MFAGRAAFLLSFWGTLFALLAQPARCDEFTYVDENGGVVTIQARLHGSGQGFQALERWDGQLQLVPTGAIRNRENTGDPTPISLAGMEDLIRLRFGTELVRVETRENMFVALILSSPLPKSGEAAANTFLGKAVRFMVNVNTTFERFAKSLKLPLRDARFPLVLLMFESDTDFEKYASEVTGGDGLSSTNILGFYSLFTNWLAVRMSSCDSFEVPLHEAIHLQVYNRLLPRLAEIPQWFNEGIATGFEGTGDKVNTNPTRVSSHYARQARGLPANADWNNIFHNDAAFSSDVLAGDAYTLAWCMHWMVVSKYPKEYAKFVEELAQRPPLERLSRADRESRFKEVFQSSIADLQSEFPKALEAAIRKQNVNMVDPSQVGRAARQQALCEYEIDAVMRQDRGGQLHVGGRIQNISTLRPMTFYLTLVTGNGVYADWLMTDVAPRKTVQLPQQIANKRMAVPPGGSADSFQVFVRSAAADSDQARAWKAGPLPGPPSR